MAKYTDLPLPPEGPSWDDTNTETAPSAESSKTSALGDPQSTRSHTNPSTSNSQTGGSEELPGVQDYLEAMGTAVAAITPMFRQPTNEILAPTLRRPGRTGVREGKPVVPMEGRSLEIASRIREMFHGYSNRQDRNQQPEMGPSEIGTPCDRRIAMSLLRLKPVNPGGDGWAAFLGTCGHVGLESMLVWADAGSGRYATEVKLKFPSRYVPKGTTDLIDRQLHIIYDWKVMGNWSLNKLRTEGPTPQYRVQAHTYGYGAKLKGEEVSAVAIVGMPREASSLDDMYVWSEPYDPVVARKALERVDAIGDSIFDSPSGIAPGPYDFPIDNSDCRFCPFYLKGAANSEGGVCNGRN